MALEVAGIASPGPESARSISQASEACRVLPPCTGLAPLLLPSEYRASEDDGRATFSRRCQRVVTAQRGPALFDSKEVYAGCQILSQCSMEFLRDLQRLGGEEGRQGKVFDPGTIVVEQGSLGFSLFILHRGELEALESSSLSTAPQYKIYNQGDSFGENQLLGLQPRHEQTVRAKTMCHVFEISCRNFMQALVQHPLERRLFEREVVTRYEAMRTRRAKPRRKKARIPIAGFASGGGFVRQTSNKGSFPSIAVVAVAAAATTPTSKGPSFSPRSGCASGAATPSSPSSPTSGRGCAKRPASGKVVVLLDDVPDLPDLATGISPQEDGHVSPSNGRKKAASFRGTLHRIANPAQATKGDESQSADTGERPSEAEEGMLIPVWWRDRRPLRTSLQEDETFVGVVRRSLKDDTKVGYRVPGRDARAAAGVSESEDCWGEVPLDLGLLPPLHAMSPVQKQNVQRQLEGRVLARRKFQTAARSALNLSKLSRLMPRRVTS